MVSSPGIAANGTYQAQLALGYGSKDEDTDSGQTAGGRSVRRRAAGFSGTSDTGRSSFTPAPLEPGEQCWLGLVYSGTVAGARESWPYVWDCVSRDYTLLRPDVLWYPAAGRPEIAFLRRSYYQPFSYDLTVEGIPEGYLAVATRQEPLGGVESRLDPPAGGAARGVGDDAPART